MVLVSTSRSGPDLPQVTARSSPLPSAPLVLSWSQQRKCDVASWHSVNNPSDSALVKKCNKVVDGMRVLSDEVRTSPRRSLLVNVNISSAHVRKLRPSLCRLARNSQAINISVCENLLCLISHKSDSKCGECALA